MTDYNDIPDAFRDIDDYYEKDQTIRDLEKEVERLNDLSVEWYKSYTKATKGKLRNAVLFFIAAALALYFGVSSADKITLEEAEAKAEAEYSFAVECAKFFYNYAVVVSESDQSHYHRYGCSDIDFDYFWIYNTEAAESRGLSPCPECFSEE